MRINKYTTLLNENRIPTLVKESGKLYNCDNTFNSPMNVYNMLTEVFNMDKLPEEYAYMLALDTKNKLIGVIEVSHGVINASILNPREVLQKALLMNACNIIIAHNHPSGDTTPSNADIQTSKRIKEACNIVGIALLDSLIIGEGYLSLGSDGLI